jgi:hypothetical protein
VALLGKRHARGPVRGELLIFNTNQQFATDSLVGRLSWHVQATKTEASMTMQTALLLGRPK